jgi:hypothetical protein
MPYDDVAEAKRLKDEAPETFEAVKASNTATKAVTPKCKHEAALAEGITGADVLVHDDRDDAWMLENATQRGNNAVAEAGNVAATIREHLANLKASGDYARIIGEMTDSRPVDVP